jgi:hypothetical protein
MSSNITPVINMMLTASSSKMGINIVRFHDQLLARQNYDGELLTVAQRNAHISMEAIHVMQIIIATRQLYTPMGLQPKDWREFPHEEFFQLLKLAFPEEGIIIKGDTPFEQARSLFGEICFRNGFHNFNNDAPLFEYISKISKASSSIPHIHTLSAEQWKVIINSLIDNLSKHRKPDSSEATTAKYVQSELKAKELPTLETYMMQFGFIYQDIKTT